jgi:uncharacterized protein
MDETFLRSSQARGNDLSTPVPEIGFPGLRPGDCWCLCAVRWREALRVGRAPRVQPTATHEAPSTSSHSPTSSATRSI